MMVVIVGWVKEASLDRMQAGSPTGAGASDASDNGCHIRPFGLPACQRLCHAWQVKALVVNDLRHNGARALWRGLILGDSSRSLPDHVPILTWRCGGVTRA